MSQLPSVLDNCELTTRTIRPGEDHNDPTWHNDPRMDKVRRLAAEAGMTLQEVGIKPTMFAPGQEQFKEIPDPRMQDRLPHDPLAFLRTVGDSPGDLPKPRPVSAEEVRRERSERVANIFKPCELIQAILERYEATLHKRWLKKTKDQKRRILLKAWPDMPVVYRPDIGSFRGWEGDHRRVGTQQRSACMWPSINQKDLPKPKDLPFLNARGRNPPAC